MKILIACLLGVLVWWGTSGANAAPFAWTPGDAMFVKTGGCAVADTPGGSHKGVLEPKAYVTIRRTLGGMAEVEKGDVRVGWVAKTCLMTTEDFFKNPACFRSSWMRRDVHLDAEHPEATARMTPIGREGGEYRLEIVDAADRVLWRSPSAASGDDSAPAVMAYFCGPEGDYWPLFLGDLDGDGRAELLMQEQHSSTERAMALYLYRWEDKNFVPISLGRCLLQDGDVYRWAACPRDMPAGTQWLDSPQGVTADGISVWTIYTALGGGETKACGTARFRLTDEGGIPVP